MLLLDEICSMHGNKRAYKLFLPDRIVLYINMECRLPVTQVWNMLYLHTCSPCVMNVIVCYRLLC